MAQVSTVPNFFIQTASGDDFPLESAMDQPLQAILVQAMTKGGSWCRVFWGSQSSEKQCVPKLELPYYAALGTKLKDLPVTKEADCLALLAVDSKVGRL